jgi:hypothetical protein
MPPGVLLFIEGPGISLRAFFVMGQFFILAGDDHEIKTDNGTDRKFA